MSSSVKLVIKMASAMSVVNLLLVASILMGASGEVYFKKGSPQVQLGNEGQVVSGQLQYSREGRPYLSFTGIPYAEVPGRFEEAKLLSKPNWDGVLDATKGVPVCPQISYTGTTGQEDCLFMNIYVPMNNTRNGGKGYPIMFNVHGGGFSMGDGIMYFGPQYYMDEDVIMITFNFRLGPLGFLSTGDSVIPGNNGMKDMVVALQFVQEHIEKFGGDPGKVTIVGVSSGGAAIHYLLMSPVAKGLFHGAICQSGTALSTWGYQADPKRNAVELATYMGCPKEGEEITSEEILECLKKVSADELIKAQGAFTKTWPGDLNSFFFIPTMETKGQVSQLTPFISEAPVNILFGKEKGEDLPNVPIIIGAAEDEGHAVYSEMIMTNQTLVEELNENWDEIVPITLYLDKYIRDGHNLKKVTDKLKKFYFDGKAITQEDGRLGLSNFYSDSFFQYGVLRTAMATAKRENSKPVYLYQYAYYGPTSPRAAGDMKDKKVSHGDDLMHHFNMGAIPGYGDLIKPNSPDEEFSKNLVRLWTSFATHGEPKHEWGNASEKKWKPISKDESSGKDSLKWFRLVANPAYIEVNQGVKDRMKFWNNLFEEHITPSILSIIKDYQQESLTKKSEL